MTPAEIGAAMRRTREYKGMSQMIVGGKLNKARTAISFAENQTQRLNLKTLIAYLDVLDLEIIIQPKRIKSEGTN